MTPTSDYTAGRLGARGASISATQLLGQVLFLVAVALGFLALGTVAGKDLSNGTALACSLGGVAMLFAQSFSRALRTGPVGMGWLFALALLLGLGLGPILNEYATIDPSAVSEAAGATALTVLGCGAAGFLVSKDLAGWMRPLTFVVLALVAVSFVMLLIGASSPLLMLAIGGISALLIVVDFNFLRRHGTEDDAIWLATGIFVSIVNIFQMFLSLLSD